MKLWQEYHRNNYSAWTNMRRRGDIWKLYGFPYEKSVLTRHVETANTQKEHISVFKTILERDPISSHVKVKPDKGRETSQIRTSKRTKERSHSQKPRGFSDPAETKFVQQTQGNSSKDECRDECTDSLQTSGTESPPLNTVLGNSDWNTPIKFKSSTKFQCFRSQNKEKALEGFLTVQWC